MREELVDEARAFFAAHLRERRPDDRVTLLGAAADDVTALDDGRRFLRLLADGGWAAPSWPTEHGGRGASNDDAAAVARELGRYETPDLYPFLVALSLVGPTVLVHGTDEQRARWLAPIVRGDEIWCQLFSEPDAGSDLAGLATRAERDGDVWRVTGQKTWSSRAHYAQWGLLLARTDPHVPKHAGITAFALPMQQPGVDVRPLRQMNGDAHFNEVFLDAAVVDDADRIGDVGAGWGVALTTLMYERAGVGPVPSGGGIHRGQVVDAVRAWGRHRDPVVRQRAAALLAEMEVARLTGLRARAAAQSGRPPGPEGSGAKLRMTQVLKPLASLVLELQGPAGVTELADEDWAAVFLTAPSISIRGGTDEIQRNIIGERVLGLPAEPRLDKDVPFAERPRSARPT